MPVGNPANAQSLNASLGRTAVQMRKVMESAQDLFTVINKLGTDGLVAAGFSSDDAATAVTLASYMHTVAGCYYGEVQQGGADGTGAILFDFNDALAALWGGQ